MKVIYKQIIATLLIGIYGFNVKSQVTLTGANSNMVPGEVINYFEGGFVDTSQNANLMPTGAQHIWDFSSLASFDTTVYNYLEADTTAYFSFAPSATVAVYYSNTNSYNYFRGTSTDYSFLGNSSGGGAGIYTNPYKYLSYPLTYQDVFLDTFKTDGTWIEYGTHTVDGYGDVIMPYGTVTGVLRLHEHAVHILLPNDTTISDYWSIRKPGVHWPIIDYYGAGWNKTIHFIEPGSTGIAEFLASADVAHCYPNPFQSHLTVTIPKQNFAQVLFSVKNLLGETVYSTEENNSGVFSSTIIDLGFLSSGIYFLETVIDGEKAVKKVVKQ